MFFNKRGTYSKVNSMFSREKVYKIRVKVHGKGGYFSPNRRAWNPLLKLIAVTGGIPGFPGFPDSFPGFLSFPELGGAALPCITEGGLVKGRGGV